MFLDIVSPGNIFSTETFPLPTEEVADEVEKASSFASSQTTMMIVGLLVLAIAVVIFSKILMKKELRNA